MAERIAENLWRLEIPLEGNPLKTLNSYLITAERNLLIDTGFRWDGCRAAMERQLNELGVDLSRTDIFSTHLHELAASVPEINERSVSRGGIKLDTLVAGIEEGQRSFKIHRAKPDGKSYARDIADKYGLSFENLMERAGKSQ